MSGMFAVGFEDYLFAGLLPGISTSLQTSVVAVAQGCAVYGLAYVLSIPLCVFMVTRFPTRTVLIMALALFITGNFITLLSPNLTLYLISRVGAGLGCGMFLPVAVAAAIQIVGTDFRGRALSMMWGANCAGAVVGVPLGLWLAQRMGWHASIMVILALASASLLGIVIEKYAVGIEALPPSLEEQLNLLLDPRVLAVVGITLLTATSCLGLYSYISQVLAGSVSSSDSAFSLWSIGGLIGSTGVGYVVDRLKNPQIVMLLILATLTTTIGVIPVIRNDPIFGLVPFFIWGAMGWASVTPQQYNLIKINPDCEALCLTLITSAVSLGGAFGTALGGMALNSGLSANHLPYVTSALVCCALVGQGLVIKGQRRWKIGLQK